MTDDVADQLQMKDTINIRSMIQASLEHYNEAERQNDRRRAGRILASLYEDLGPLRELDDSFADEWARIRPNLHVQLFKVVRCHLQWHHLSAAKQAITFLLDRRGMGLRAELPPEYDVERADHLQRLERKIRARRSPAPRQDEGALP